MIYVVNQKARLSPNLRKEQVEWVIEAPVRGQGLRRTTVSEVSHPALCSFLRRIGGSPTGGHIRVDASMAAQLSAVGLLVPPDAVPTDLAFCSRLGEAKACISGAEPLLLNERIRIAEAPAAAGMARGRTVVVAEPVRSVEVPYWIDRGEAALIDDLLARRRTPTDIARHVRESLVGAGVLYQAEKTRYERRRFQRSLAVCRERIDGPGYAILSDLLPSGLLAAIRRHMRCAVAEGYLRFGDAQVERRFSMHNEPVCMWLHALLTPLVERAVSRPIKRTYAFAAAYTEGAVLHRHTDRAACEYTLSLTVDAEPNTSSEAAWPLCLESDSEGAVVQALLAPGDALLFRGRRLHHYRDALGPGRTSTSILLHFVERSYRGAMK